MGRLRLCKKFWKFPSRCFTFSANQEHPSQRMPTSYILDSLNDLDLRVLCDQILALFQRIEGEYEQENTSTSRQRPREIWPKLSCIPFLKELFAESQPDSSVLDPYFPKGENEPSTLAYIILRDISASHRLAVGLLSLGSALENWGNIHRNRDECLFEFKEMCYLAKLLCHVRYPMMEIQKLQEAEYRGVDLLLQGSVTCSVNANPLHLTRYLSVCLRRESLLELRRRTEKTCDNLCSILDSGIFYGIRSSPLEGGPGMSYPFHAVDIEREKKEIIEMLQWGSRRKRIAVIVEGPAGVGKTTVADAVFTSVHVPKCNYIRYTWFDRFQQVTPRMRQDHWMRYRPKIERNDATEGQREKLNFDECEEDEDANVDGDEDGKEYYDESEDSDGEAGNQSQGGRERERWVFDGEKDEMLQDLVYREDEDHYYYEDSDAEANKYRGRWVINREDKTQHDLVYWESKADADAAKQTHVCSFVYFDNPLWDLSEKLQNFLNRYTEGNRKVRIVVTTRNMEYAMKECKSVLTEDCIYTYIMKPNQEEEEEESSPAAASYYGINNFREKSVKILRSSMGSDAWQTLELFGCLSTSNSNEQRINAHAAVSKLISLCECVPGSLLLVGKFIATQPCAIAAMRQLLSILCTESDDGNEKWQRLAKELLRRENYVTEEEEENECMDDALEIICFLFNGYPMKEIEDVFEEGDVLKRLRDRGLLCVDNDDAWYAYVPYIIWQHVVTTQNPRHRFIGSLPEAQALDNQLQMDALQDKEKLIKILYVMNHDDRYGPSYCMDAFNLRRLARTLHALYSKSAYQQTLDDGDGLCMEKLLIYECWRDAPLALHNCPRLRRLALRSFQNDNIMVDSIQIPVEVRYLYLESNRLSEDIKLSSFLSSVAKLKNLRSLKLHLRDRWNEELNLPEELCMLSIRELSIWSDALKELPHNFANMKYLQVLRLRCPQLKQLPRDFGRLLSLTELAFRGCQSLQNVGRDVCTLQSLHTLHWTWTWTLTLTVPLQLRLPLQLPPLRLPWRNWYDDAWLNGFMKMKSLRVLVLDEEFHERKKLDENYDFDFDFDLRPPFLLHHPHHHVQVFWDHGRKTEEEEWKN